MTTPIVATDNSKTTPSNKDKIMQAEITKNGVYYDADDIDYILGYFAEPHEKSLRYLAEVELLHDFRFEFVKDNNVYVITIPTD